LLENLSAITLVATTSALALVLIITIVVFIAKKNIMKKGKGTICFIFRFWWTICDSLL